MDTTMTTTTRAVLLAISLLLSLSTARAFESSGTGPDVHIQAWEDASPASLDKARACLPAVLQSLYMPAMYASTSVALNQSDARLRIEQAILFTLYQRLSTDWALCKAFSQALRMGEHLVAVYVDEWNTKPALFPRHSLTNGTATCTAAIDALPTISERHAIYELFRHRFTDGTVCLRRYTVHGRVPTAQGVV